MDFTLVEQSATEPLAPASEASTARAILVAAVKSSLRAAMAGQSKVASDVLQIPGMSGKRYRMFINNLIASLHDPRYIEIGSWAGSTLCSAINGNVVRATAIDNWSQFGGPKAEFFANLERFRTPKAYVNFIESDFRNVPYAELGPFNVYLFDGPHEKRDQFDGLDLVMPALDPAFVLVVDDWNSDAVRAGTEDAIAQCNLDVHYKFELRTTLDDTHAPVAGAESDWHNGYLLAVLSKGA